MEKPEVWISSAAAPAFLSAAVTAATRALFALTASSTVGDCVCTPTVKEKRSGWVRTRPVPVTLTVSSSAASRGAPETCCAASGAASIARMVNNRDDFMYPPVRRDRMADPNDKVPGQPSGRFYVDSQCIDCD